MSVPRSRARWLWLWAAVSLLAVVAAFVLGSRVRSPWDTAVANSRANPLVTATAAERTLAVAGRDVTGRVALGRTQDIAAPGGEGVRAVVTATPLEAGSAVAAGWWSSRSRAGP